MTSGQSGPASLGDGDRCNPDRFVGLDRLLSCDWVTRILAGAVDDTRYAALEQLVNGLPALGIDVTVDFRSAAAIYRSARRAGRTICSINDCLIAAVCIRHGAVLVHRDADFEVIAAFTGLIAQSFR